MSGPGKTWTHEVGAHDVLPGDVIKEFDLGLGKGWVNATWTVGSVDKDGIHADHGGAIHWLLKGDTSRWRVVRAKRGWRGAATAGPKADSPWNGTCPRCGKGTYTGFAAVEHEGGGCP